MTTQWSGCYNDSWQGVLVPDAFAHPAKFAPGLISRILRHMLERGYIAPGDSIVDPFGGIAAGGYWAMLLGLHWTGVELEPRFVELGQRNIAKWQHDLRGLGSRLGTARLLQGDSRRLLEVVGGGMGAAVSSPPYDTDVIRTRDAGNREPNRQGAMRDGAHSFDAYGSTPGQLGSMPSGDYAAVVSSPPYEESVMGATDYDERMARLISQPFDSLAPRWQREVTKYIREKRMTSSGHQLANATYGTTDGQLGSMPPGSFDSAVSSPPYSDMIDGQGEGPGARYDPIYHNGDNAYKQSSANGYGTTPGNLGSMAGEGFEAAVSSPPYEANTVHGGSGIDESKYADKSKGRPEWSPNNNHKAMTDYGSDPANIGNDTGDTFWSAARVIVEQTYAALRPGGYAAFVTKDFVRKGQRVPFSDQWEALCAAVGFQPVERIHAMLVEEHGTQLGLFGDDRVLKKERMSFFRRLAHKRGSPYIGHEDVIILRKLL